MTISTLYPSQCILGESPMWHTVRKSCFWVDIQQSLLFEFNMETKNARKWKIEDHVSLIVEGKGDNVILAVRGGLLSFNTHTGHKQWLVNIDKDIPGNRCNDGACDSEGRLWVGTMDMGCKDNLGSLYRVDYNLDVKKIINDLTIPNGVVWSLTNERMYFIDSPSRCIKSYLFNKQSGEIYFEKVAVDIPSTMGMPDGMTIDAEGMLWVALYGGCGICRCNPFNGKLLDIIELPAVNITNCQFVGEDLDRMVVTSAREGLNDQQLKEYPESGNVFIITDLSVNGVKSNIATL